MLKINLPQEFVETIETVFEEDGKKFIKDLPMLIEEVSARWKLGDINPVSNLSYNFVAYAKQKDKDIILKLGVARENYLVKCML